MRTNYCLVSMIFSFISKKIKNRSELKLTNQKAQ